MEPPLAQRCFCSDVNTNYQLRIEISYLYKDVSCIWNDAFEHSLTLIGAVYPQFNKILGLLLIKYDIPTIQCTICISESYVTSTGNVDLYT